MIVVVFMCFSTSVSALCESNKVIMEMNQYVVCVVSISSVRNLLPAQILICLAISHKLFLFVFKDDCSWAGNFSTLPARLKSSFADGQAAIFTLQ